jgi:hypothetical protein
MADSVSFQEGHKVKAKQSIYEVADDHSPGGYLCRKGDVLIVRTCPNNCTYPLYVSHEPITDRSFGVSPEELEVMPC